jgi:LysM repeat protein
MSTPGRILVPMTATGDAPTLDDERPPDPAWRVDDPPPELVHQVCPYLQGEGGGWRSLQPTRDHRCAATQPAAEPALTKQRDLCLRSAHETCATYVAARALEQGEVPDPRVEAGLWPTTKQSVLALRPERSGVSGMSPRASRTVGQGVLAALIVGAFLVLAVARTSPSGAGDLPPASFAAAAPATQPAVVVSGSDDPSPVASDAAPSPSEAANPSEGPASPSPSDDDAAPSPSGATGASPTPSVPLARYKVRGGDTLSSIAIAYGVTVKALRKANGLDGNMIRPGQELVIPGGAAGG